MKLNRQLLSHEKSGIQFLCWFRLAEHEQNIHDENALSGKAFR
ncbi:hypothetical protein SH668x_001545 [Planctomicrobium sp. SH668]